MCQITLKVICCTSTLQCTTPRKPYVMHGVSSAIHVELLRCTPFSTQHRYLCKGLGLPDEDRVNRPNCILPPTISTRPPPHHSDAPYAS